MESFDPYVKHNAKCPTVLLLCLSSHNVVVFAGPPTQLWSTEVHRGTPMSLSHFAVSGNMFILLAKGGVSMFSVCLNSHTVSIKAFLKQYLFADSTA